jgi:hypothetical protein
VEPQFIPACGAYVEFVFDFDVFYFTKNRHGKSCKCSTFIVRY